MRLDNAAKLENEISNLLGDILLSVGSISYLGAFIGKYRQLIIDNNWIPKILKEEIICSQPFSLKLRIGDEIEIQDWILNGLPQDSLSIENTIIMNNSE